MFNDLTDEEKYYKSNIALATENVVKASTGHFLYYPYVPLYNNPDKD